MGRKTPCQELTRFVQLFGYNSVLVTDKRSDRHRQADTKYRANIALHGKNYWVKNRPLSYFADSGTVTVRSMLGFCVSIRATVTSTGKIRYGV